MDPVRRGLLFSQLARMVGMSIEDVGATLRKLAGQTATKTDKNRQKQTKTDENESQIAENVTRVDVRQLKGLAAAESWLLGALLVEPALYLKIRDDMSLNLFVTFHQLAGVLIEYLENHDDPNLCKLTDLTTQMEDWGEGELIRQAIELEKKTSDWLDPQFSPLHNKMLKNSADDRGLSLESVIRDSLRQLHEARGNEDPNITADLGPQRKSEIEGEASTDAEAKELEELKALVDRQKRRGGGGGDLGNVGLGR